MSERPICKHLLHLLPPSISNNNTISTIVNPKKIPRTGAVASSISPFLHLQHDCTLGILVQIILDMNDPVLGAYS